MTVSRAAVVAEAKSFLSTPYQHQGRLKNVGVDCAGLVICVARNLGLVAPDFDVNGYDRAPDGKTLIAECEKFMDPIRMDELRSGDVLVLKFEEDPQHLGIVGDYMFGGHMIIHAYGKSNGKGKVEERRVVANFKSMRPVQAYRIRGVI